MRRARPLVAALVALACLSVSTSTLAQGRIEATRDYLARMDTDGDGRVSLSEYLAWMGYAFREMDLDGDGVLVAHELPGGRGGPVTAEQHRARLADRFARQDQDGDGLLDARELAAPPQR